MFEFSLQKAERGSNLRVTTSQDSKPRFLITDDLPPGMWKSDFCPSRGFFLKKITPFVLNCHTV